MARMVSSLLVALNAAAVDQPAALKAAVNCSSEPMNIMFVTVRSRTREIGIRKAVGATRREIRLQFLVEAIFISAAGGMIGTFLGMAIPVSVRLFTDYHLPISGLSIIVAVLVSSLVGLIFGTVPASRAANLDPVESLRYE